MEAILVTGGAGFIGSHVCKSLAKEGYLPVTYDNLCHGHEWAVKWGPLIQKDLNDSGALDEAIEKYKPVGVIHLASYINARESIIDPVRYYLNNVGASLSLLEAMQRHQIKYLVFSSSASVYGHPQYFPIDEKHPTVPTTPYGKSKLVIEEMLQDLFNAYGLISASLRYFNAAGADADNEIGEAHFPETHLLPLIILTALKKRSHLTIFGTDHDTEDGTAVRDYIHVSDLADAHVKTLNWLREHQRNVTLNLGTGHGYSVQQAIDQVMHHTSLTIPIKVESSVRGEPPSLVANASLAKQLLKWEPKHSSLENIIKTAWKWHAKTL